MRGIFFVPGGRRSTNRQRKLQLIAVLCAGGHEAHGLIQRKGGGIVPMTGQRNPAGGAEGLVPDVEQVKEN